MDAYTNDFNGLMHAFKGMSHMSYMDFKLYSQMDIIIEPLLSYMNTVNNLTPDEFESIQSFRLGLIWRNVDDWLPLVFRFPPKLTSKPKEELVGHLSTFIILKHSSEDVTEQKQLLDNLLDKLKTVELFVTKHESKLRKRTRTGNRHNIVSAFREALEISYRGNDFQI